MGFHPDITWKETGQKIAKPYKEALEWVGSAVLRLADVSLRVLDLVGRFTKMMVKTVMEWFVNTLTVLTKLLGWIFVKPEDNALTELFISAKDKLFNLCDACISRPLKNACRFFRNKIARFFTRRNPDMQAMEVLGEWAKQSDEFFSSSTAEVKAAILEKGGDISKKVLPAQDAEEKTTVTKEMKLTSHSSVPSQHLPPVGEGNTSETSRLFR
jgi:hypothetical protein